MQCAVSVAQWNAQPIPLWRLALLGDFDEPAQVAARFKLDVELDSAPPRTYPSPRAEAVQLITVVLTSEALE